MTTFVGFYPGAFRRPKQWRSDDQSSIDLAELRDQRFYCKMILLSEKIPGVPTENDGVPYTLGI